MKKILIILGFIVILFTGIIVFVQQRIGNILPAVLPPSKSTSQTNEDQQNNSPKKGYPLTNPLKIPDGFEITIFAKDLGAVRDLEFSPEGTLLASIPSQGKVVALPDKNNDGKVDNTVEILSNQTDKPHGLAFYNNNLYVVGETQLLKFGWSESVHKVTEKPEFLLTLPQGGRHTTRTIAFDKNGTMFVSIGSSCDVCFEKHEWLGAVITADKDGKNAKLFAKGLRNAVFITVHPETNELWGTEMSRDFLGDNIPPDEINIIQNGKDYGWPLCYGDQILDGQFTATMDFAKNPCLTTEKPIYKIPAHSAPLGLTFWEGDLLVAYHGSWNSSTPVGYKVVRMNVEGNTITGEEDFITGFIDGSQAAGRPVDIISDKQGNIYISDDKAGVIYLVTKKS